MDVCCAQAAQLRVLDIKRLSLTLPNTIVAYREKQTRLEQELSDHKDNLEEFQIEHAFMDYGNDALEEDLEGSDDGLRQPASDLEDAGTRDGAPESP